MASDVKFEFSPRSYNTHPVANDDEKRNQRRNKLFRRIQMDIKDRDRLRKKLGGVKTVRYIDPQRDVAVELGERDIRREIMKHRGRLKNSMLADEADNPGFLLLLEQAEREMRNSRPEVAATYLTKAAQIHPDNVVVRTLRGKALLMCGQYEAALEDVSTVLVQLNTPGHPGALLVQAGALYSMGDFEHALVSYHKADSLPNLLIREREEIMDGIQQSEEAIKKILEKTGNAFETMETCIEALGSDFLSLSLYEFKASLTNCHAKDRSKAEVKDDFDEDIKYIDNFITKINQLGGNPNMMQQASSARDYLEDRKEFWSQQRVGRNKHS